MHDRLKDFNITEHEKFNQSSRTLELNEINSWLNGSWCLVVDPTNRSGYPINTFIPHNRPIRCFHCDPCSVEEETPEGQTTSQLGVSWQSLYLNQEFDLLTNLDCKLLENRIHILIIFVHLWYL